MYKGLLVLAAVVTLCRGASLRDAAAIEDQECQSTTELWGGPDIRKVYFCVNDVVYEDSCRTNTYFVRNETLSGCIPAIDMNPNCVNTAPVGPCEGNNLRQPQPSTNLGSYFVCPSEGATPIELNCPDQKAFISQDGYLGCFHWTFWRQLRNCPL